MNATEMLLIALMVALVAGLILLAGCTAQDNQNGAAGGGNTVNAPSSSNAGGFSGARNFTGGQGSFNASNRGAGRNGSGAGMLNVTPEQRQQMIAQRMAQMAVACEGKSAGDACSIASSGNATGSCTALNGTLACSFGSGTGGFGNGGNAPPQPQ